MAPGSTIKYTPRKRPPAVSQMLTISVSHNDVADFLSELNGLMKQRLGASIYLTDSELTHTHCRFEWTHSLDGAGDFRLAIEVRYTGSAISDACIWFTPVAALDLESYDLSTISTRAKSTLFQTIIDTALLAADKSRHKHWLVPYWFELRPPHLNPSAFSLVDGSCSFGPSMSIPSGRPGLLTLIRARSATLDGARLRGSAIVTLLQQTLTLSTGTLVKVNSSLTGQLTRQFATMSEESNPLSPPLIESASALNASTKDTRFAEILSHAWACRQLLSINNRQLFDCSLAAFYSAKRSEHKSPTISAIAYVAAIGALSKKKRRRCKGKVSCADCGPLPLAHDLVGDRAAITELLLEAIGYAPSSGEGKFLSHVVRRVYSHQRSSYVHDAILRHSEEVLGGGSFAAMPRDGDPIASSLLAKNDLIVLSQAAQRTLLWWLFNSANPPGHIEFGQFEPLRLSGEIEVTAPGHSTVFINEGSGVRFRSASGDGEIRASMSIMDAVSNFASKTNSSQSY